MIVFANILKLLSDHGWSTYRLQKENQLPNGTIIRLRNKQPITTNTIDTICRLCSCQPGDILKYVPGEEPED